MKIVIEHGKIKREINGPFNICGSNEDLRAVADAISRALESTARSYGWVEIVGTPQRNNPNTLPVAWDQEKAS